VAELISRTLFSINSYRGDSKKFEELKERHSKYKMRNKSVPISAKLGKWNVADELAFQASLKRASKTLTFITIKQNWCSSI